MDAQAAQVVESEVDEQSVQHLPDSGVGLETIEFELLFSSPNWRAPTMTGGIGGLFLGNYLKCDTNWWDAPMRKDGIGVVPNIWQDCGIIRCPEYITCSICCGKCSYIHCYTCCKNSVCRRCLRDLEFRRFQGQYGFCTDCLELALLFEEGKDHDSDGVLVDFSDRDTTAVFNGLGNWLSFGCAKLGQLLMWEWKSESSVLKQQGHYFDGNCFAYLSDSQLLATEIDPAFMPFNCRWIFSVLNKAISKTVLSLDFFEFFDAATTLYSWWQFQLCDVFIEIITPYFAGNNPTFASAKRSAQNTLRLCLDYDLLLLHPFMPTVTEELWQRLPSKIDYVWKESILISEYPSVTFGFGDLVDNHYSKIGRSVASNCHMVISKTKLFIPGAVYKAQDLRTSRFHWAPHCGFVWDGGGDDVKKKGSMLVYAGINLMMHVEDGGRYILLQVFISPSSRTRISSTGEYCHVPR